MTSGNVVWENDVDGDVGVDAAREGCLALWGLSEIGKEDEEGILELEEAAEKEATVAGDGETMAIGERSMKSSKPQ